MPPYLVLLRAGFALPLPLPEARCALTAPFHPYRGPGGPWRYIFCGTFRRLAPPRHYLAPCPVEPGLSSPRVDDVGSDCLANSRRYCIKRSVEWLVTERLRHCFESFVETTEKRAFVDLSQNRTVRLRLVF